MMSSALVTHLHDRAWDTLVAPVPSQPEHIAPDLLLPQTLAREEEGDLWKRLRTGFQLPPQLTPSAQVHVDSFRSHSHHIAAILQRGEPYLFFILSRIEARGLPAELALLPVIESAFDPFVRSPAGAAGIWQFMPATAKQAGLRRDWWVDGRQDIVAATEAALDYLSELQQRFDGDWLLALSAYNAGSARVNKAIRLNQSQGKPVDFWHLPLPKETRNYVPKLIALRAIIANPEAHNIELPAMANSRYFSAVETGGQLDLQVAAQLAGTDLDELRRLNPGLIRSITPPSSLHTLLIPRASEQQFRQQLARLPAEQRVQSVQYRVRSGDTLSAIAQHSRTTVARLRQINQLDSTRIFAGKLLIVPLGGGDENTGGALQAS
jgi:membrane-bound lytic murein transglycosylase D